MFGAGKISRRWFKNYTIDTTYEEYKPTLRQLLEEVPLETLREYLKDICEVK